MRVWRVTKLYNITVKKVFILTLVLRPKILYACQYQRKPLRNYPTLFYQRLFYEKALFYRNLESHKIVQILLISLSKG